MTHDLMLKNVDCVTVQSPEKPKPVQRKPPSPTVNTKAAMAEVFELFNQTLTVGRRGNGDIDEDDEDEDSDDSEDDEDEEDDEDMKTSAVPPTPLPMPGTAPRVGMSMPTPSRMVPATPTPAQGYLSGRKQTGAVGAIFEEKDEGLPVLRKPAFAIFSDENAKPAVFADENAKPSVFQDENAPKPAKLAVYGDENAPGPVFADENAVNPVFQDENAPRGVFPDENARSSKASNSNLRESVFGQTPMKTPLAPRTAKPLAAVSEVESPERSASVFADQRYTTPVPAKRMFGQAKPTTSLAETFEEDAIREGEADEHQEYLQDETDYNPRRIVRCGGAFDMMTPITERTCEYTQSTQGFTLRSSTSSALTQSQRKAMDEDEEFDQDQEDEEVLAERQGLSVVQEESESSRVSDRHQAVYREVSPQVPFDDATGEQGSRRSDASHSLFRLSPGHTIQPRAAVERVVEEEVVAETHATPAAEAPQVELEKAQVATKPAQTAEQDAGVAAPDISDARPEKLMVPVQDIPSPTSEAVVMFNPTNPCCPTDPDVMQPLIAALQPPITQLPNFVDLRTTTSGQLEDLQKTAKSRVRRTSTSTGSKAPATGAWELTLHGRKFEIEEKIGEGGFGAVFKAIDLAARDAADEASDDEDDEANPEALYTLALKVEKPANVWEAVVLDRIRTRVAPEHHPSIVKSRGLYCYQDESILLLDYYNQGTLLDAVNKAAAWGIAAPAAGASGGLDETLAIFFTIELLRVVEALHRADFIHGDLKIDNCLIRLEETDEWVSQYEMNGENGWSGKGIHLIDLGRTIDLRAYPQGTAQTFVADWPVDAKDCQEMRDGRPWSYEADYYGLASVCYCMLFGKYISTELAPVGANDGDKKRYKINGSFKRVSPGCSSMTLSQLPLTFLSDSTGKPNCGSPCSTCCSIPSSPRVQVTCLSTTSSQRFEANSSAGSKKTAQEEAGISRIC
jgi:checkpoint serine/threonine-protein kinase